MLVSDFDFPLPPERIAQTPAETRDGSRLMTLDRASGSVEHHRFFELPDLLQDGDLLLLNDTKVIPARLHGTRESGGKVELLLLEEVKRDCWKALARPAKKVRVGDTLFFGPLRAVVLETGEEGERVVRLESELPIREALERIGELPLPPYITEKPTDDSRYQTVYAKEEGSAAAPT
ncbi:MAG: S-adenosylmethionine:tRNA ribosyltransferase-isomerase, partial [Bacteroidota bacterium]